MVVYILLYISIYCYVSLYIVYCFVEVMFIMLLFSISIAVIASLTVIYMSSFSLIKTFA